MLYFRIHVILFSIFLLSNSACTSKEDRADSYFADGLVLLENKNYPKAVLAFKNVLQITPKFSEARYRLGVAEEKQENWRNAIGNYLAAADLNQTYILPRARLAELYLLAKRIDKAVTFVDEIVAINPNDPSGLALQGRIFSLQGKSEKAFDSAKKAVAIDPAHTGAVTLLSSLYILQGKNNEGISVLEKGVSLNANNINLKLVLSKKYAVIGQNKKAINLLRELISTEPDVVLHQVRMADFQKSIGQFKAAEDTLRKAVKGNPDNTNLKLVLINFMSKQRDEKSAEKILQQFIEASPKEPMLRFGLAQIYSRQKERNKLKSVYDSIITLDASLPSKLKAQVQLANVYIDEDKYDKALLLVNEVLIKNPGDQQALITRGAIAIKQRKLAVAITDFRTILKSQPKSVLALSSLAKAHALNGEFELSKSYYQQAILLDIRNAELLLEMAKVFALLDDMPSALDVVNQSLSVDTNSLEAMQVKVKILLSQKSWNRADNLTEEIQKTYPKNYLGFYLRGLVYASKKSHKSAVVQFEKALILSTKNIKSLRHLIASRLIMKNQQAAINDIEKYIEKNPDDYLAYNMAGEIKLRQQNFNDSMEYFQAAIKIAPTKPASYRNMARLYVYQKQPLKALELLRKALQQSDDDMTLMFDLASLTELSGNKFKAISIYEKILTEKPDSAKAINNLAMLLLQREGSGDLDKASNLVETIKHIDNPNYQDTVGWIKFKRGEIDEALQFILVAANSAPKNAEINYHLAMIYHKRDELALAKKYLKIAFSTGKEFEGIERAKDVFAKL